MKKKFSKEGQKVEVESCPNCKEELVVKMDQGTEVFICENCKFKKKK